MPSLDIITYNNIISSLHIIVTYHHHILLMLLVSTHLRPVTYEIQYQVFVVHHITHGQVWGDYRTKVIYYNYNYLKIGLLWLWFDYIHSECNRLRLRLDCKVIMITMYITQIWMWFFSSIYSVTCIIPI